MLISVSFLSINSNFLRKRPTPLQQGGNVDWIQLYPQNPADESYQSEKEAGYQRSNCCGNDCKAYQEEPTIEYGRIVDLEVNWGPNG
jgi:hypothetical protein